MNDGEKRRIEEAGGRVMIQRINGSLAVSRALGDFEYKQRTDRGNNTVKEVFSRDRSFVTFFESTDNSVICSLKTYIGNNADWKHSTVIRNKKRNLETVKWDWKHNVV